LQINDDGSSYLFSGRAAQVMGQGFFVIEELVAGLTVRFVHLMGAIYARARYLGPVDLGVAVTNLRGAVSVMAQHNVVGYDFPPFDQPEYRRTARFSAEELALNPQLVAKQLVMPLIQATTQDRKDPFPRT
jgi:hypothetical protein